METTTVISAVLVILVGRWPVCAAEAGLESTHVPVGAVWLLSGSLGGLPESER